MYSIVITVKQLITAAINPIKLKTKYGLMKHTIVISYEHIIKIGISKIGNF